MSQEQLFKTPEPKIGELEAKAVDVLRALEVDGALPELQSLNAALFVSLARAIDRGLATPRLTIATLTAVNALREINSELIAPRLASSIDDPIDTAREAFLDKLKALEA